MMAAVAGSKGHIAVCSNDNTDFRPRPSFQARVALRVLDGVLTPEEGAEEILARAKLREVGIDTNMVCNLRCKYCYLDDRLEEQGKLAADEWLQRLTPLAINGCKLFAFIGKEPLTDDTAITVLKGLSKLRGEDLNFRTGMVTNGTLLSRYLDRLLETDISYLDISLDGLPHVNDTWRGAGTGQRVLENLRLILSRDPQCDLFVTSVLHQGNLKHIVEFASALFDMGLKGFFTSPILKFTRNDQIEHWAVTPSDVEKTIDALLRMIDRLPQCAEHQVIIDLPYRYAWWLVAREHISPDQIVEDAYEVPYYQPEARLPLFLKMNFLSFSYWRATRITHDGIPVENLDLAAHPQYHLDADATNPAVSTTRHFGGSRQAYGFHVRFLDAHLAISHSSDNLYDLFEGTHAEDVELKVIRSFPYGSGTAAPHDRFVIEQVSNGNYRDEEHNDYIVLGGICDPSAPVENRNELKIVAAVVKRLGFLLLFPHGWERSWNNLVASTISSIWAHGDYTSTYEQQAQPSSSAQALSRNIRSWKGASPEIILKGGPITDVPIPEEHNGAVEMVITANYPEALKLATNNEAVAVPAPDLFPEWSRLLLSALLTRQSLTAGERNILEAVVIAINKACHCIHYEHRGASFANTLIDLYPHVFNNEPKELRTA